jgi:GTPase SAR1 family protein
LSAENLAGRRDFVKMVVIGDTNVGKTALINQFMESKFI